MRRTWTIALILGLLLVASFQMIGQENVTLPQSPRAEERPLLIFHSADKASNASVRKQLDLLHAHRAELKDRDVSVRMVPDEHGIGSQAARKDWAGLRSRFHVASAGFTVVLVGKDGGEKFRSRLPVTIEKLIALIDAMPMRQQEVKDGHPE